MDQQHGTRFATSGSHTDGCSATQLCTLARPRLCADGTVEHTLLTHQCVRACRMCEGCFSMTGATILSGVGCARVPACLAYACPLRVRTTARKGAATGLLRASSSTCEAQIWPPIGQCVHGRLHATAWHAGLATHRPEASSTKPETAPRCAVYQEKKTNEPAINLVPNPTAWPGGTLAPSHVSQGVLFRD